MGDAVKLIAKGLNTSRIYEPILTPDQLATKVEHYRLKQDLVKHPVVTRGWCVAKFNVANDTAGRDLKELTELGVLSLQGKGRSVRYVLRKTVAESTDNRPT